MKKIIVNANIVWTITNFRTNLIKHLIDNGYEVICIADKDDFSKEPEAILEKLNVNLIKVKLSRSGINPIEDLKYWYSLLKIYKSVKPDIILNYTIKPNIYGTIAASLLNIPTINNIAGLGTLFVKEGLVTKAAKLLYKYSQSKATKIFFQNKDDFDLFTIRKLVDRNKCDILPGSGVDTNRFRPIKQDKTNDKLVFLLISRMLWDKGIKEYIEAARIIKKKYSNVEFQLLGFIDMSNKTAISKAQIDEWTKEGVVTYLGTSDHVENEILQVDCIVLPSFYREGTPKTLLESASMEKPIITTNNIGCKDVVDDGVNGYLCKIKDSNDLADKIEKMINLSEEERNLMGKEGRKKIINDFDEKIVFKKYLESIKEILG